MKILSSFAFVAVTLRSGANAHQGFAVRPQTTKNVKGLVAATTLRGGGLGVEPEVAGKIVSAAFLTQGAAFSLAPTQQNELYGWGDSPYTQFLTEILGSAVLAIGVASYNMLYQRMDVHKALGWCAVVCMVAQFKWLLDGTFKAAGMGIDKVLFQVVPNLIYIYVGFTSPDWATKFFKGVMAMWTITALHGIFFTEASGKLWGSFPPDKQVQFSAKGFMYSLLALEVHNYSLLQGVDPAKALAYALIVGWVYLFDSFFISKEISEVSKKPTAYTFWMLWFSFFIPAILLSSAEPVVAAD